MTTDPGFFKKCIQDELVKRCERNPRYSLRAFARAIGLDPGTLSQILAGKRVPSLKMSQKILSGLDLSSEDERSFLASLAETHRKRGLSRLNPVFRKEQPEVGAKVRELTVEQFRLIAEWYHCAIIELTYVPGFNSDPQWIAAALGITPSEARLATERLLRLGLLVKREGGKLEKSEEQFTTASKNLTTAAQRKHQSQFLEKAMYSLENDPIECRNNTAMIMAIDPEKVPAAKEMIREFNRKLCRFLESGKRRQVYVLGVALCPLQRGGMGE